MLKLSIQADPELIQSFYNLIKQVIHRFNKELAISVDLPADDWDLVATWEESLSDALRSDCEHLLFLLQDERLGREVFEIDHELAEPVLRACSAVRLKMHSLLLADIPPELLEMHTLDPSKLPDETHEAYTCSLFLAALQSHLVEALDPEVSNF